MQQSTTKIELIVEGLKSIAWGLSVYHVTNQIHRSHQLHERMGLINGLLHLIKDRVQENPLHHAHSNPHSHSQFQDEMSEEEMY